jgi:serine/threonine protein kinase
VTASLVIEGALLSGRYRTDVLLGRGGMGEVWRCRDFDQDRDVAIKVVRADLFADAGASRLFEAEIHAVARLSHPSIVPVYDYFREGDAGYLVLAYQRGAPLHRFARVDVTFDFVRSVLLDVLRGLAFAHARGVLHLDIKPENLIIDTSSGVARATIVDFGIARVKRPGRGVERWLDRDAVIGTLEYMAPEQCTGSMERIGPWTDLYALGTLAYELCAGRRPFPNAPLAEALRVRTTEHPPRLVPVIEGVPMAFLDLCERLIARDPVRRPMLAADVIEAIERMDLARNRAPASPFVDQPEHDKPTVVSAFDARTVPIEESVDTVDEPPPEVRVHAPLTEITPLDLMRAADSARPVEDEPLAGAYGLFGLREVPVLGRTEERAAVWEAVRAAVVERKPTVVLLEGPAGSGKSRLARDALERASELGVATTFVTWWSQEASGDDGLRGLVENVLDARGAALDDLRARTTFWLERTCPGDARDHALLAREIEHLLRPRPDAAPDPGLPLRVAVDVIALAAAARSAVVWLDDAPWSRGEAVALIQALIAREPRVAVCVIATSREEDATKATGMTTLRALSQSVRVQPLDRDATRKLARGLLEIDDELCELLATRAEGNPLFLTQLLAQLVGAEVVERREGSYRLVRAFDLESVPADIRAVWQRRVEQSGADPKVLSAVALVRERPSVAVVEDLATCLAAATGAVGLVTSFSVNLRRAARAGLVRLEGGAYVWAHGLLREHLVHAVDGPHERALHAACASALAPLIGREDVQEERARHFAKAGRAREACEAMLAAAMWSFRRAENEARAERCEALRQWASDARLVDLEARALAELAYLDAEAGHVERAMEGATEALDVLDQARDQAERTVVAARAFALSRKSQILRLATRTQEGAVATRAALALAKNGAAPEVEVTSLLQLGLDETRAGNTETARGFLDQAAARARAIGDKAGEARARLLAGAKGTPEEELAAAEEAITLAIESGNDRVELICKQVWVDALWRAGQLARARTEAGGLSREAARRSLRQTVALVELQCASWALLEGDTIAARAHRVIALRWGAETGALIERELTLTIDLLLALIEANATSASALLDALEALPKRMDEQVLRELRGRARALAPASIAARL